jgi:hypothetical protein
LRNALSDNYLEDTTVNLTVSPIIITGGAINPGANATTLKGKAGYLYTTTPSLSYPLASGLLAKVFDSSTGLIAKNPDPTTWGDYFFVSPDPDDTPHDAFMNAVKDAITDEKLSGGYFIWDYSCLKKLVESRIDRPAVILF